MKNMKKLCYLVIDRETDSINNAYDDRSQAKLWAEELNTSRIAKILLKEGVSIDLALKSNYKKELKKLKDRGVDYYVDDFDLSADCEDEEKRKLIEDLLKNSVCVDDELDLNFFLGDDFDFNFDDEADDDSDDEEVYGFSIV